MVLLHSLMRRAGGAVRAASCGITLGLAAVGLAAAAIPAPATGLSPDQRPVLVLEVPEATLMLVHHAVRMPDRQAESLALKLGYWIAAAIIRRDREERRAPLPAAWQIPEADRGFAQTLRAQLSNPHANWPWRSLIVSASGPDRDSQLQSLAGQDAVLAVVREELVDLRDKVELHVVMDLTTVRAVATGHESRSHTHVEYFAPSLAAQSSQPRRSLEPFAVNGPLDEQVGTAATDLGQFLATIVARVSVPESLHPHNPTLGELGVHPACGECRPADPVVYQQPGRVWVRLGRPPGAILALPLPARPMRQSLQQTSQGHSARPDHRQAGS